MDLRRRMRVISWKRLRQFADAHADALTPLRIWRKLMESQQYETPQALKNTFGKRVDFLKNGITVFDVGGNKYRISTRIRYEIQCAFVRRVMTHAEYMKAIKDGTL